MWETNDAPDPATAAMEEGRGMKKDNRRFDPQKRGMLVGPERLARWEPTHLLLLAGLQMDQSALDLGCGPGFWTLPIAEIVGKDGQVIALDASPEMLRSLAAQSPPAHVRLMQGELPTISLSDASMDFIWAALVFHEVTPAASLATEARRVLRPAHRLAVLEWRTDAASSIGPPRGRRLSPQQLNACLLSAGFHEFHLMWQDEDTYLASAN
jgi:ubiquinone/menaquinone biosynthesis C-methylase UbiE